MIVALEGPDKCGKSTLFSALRVHPRLQHATFVGAKSVTAFHRAGCMAEAEKLIADFWIDHYDPARLYILDRSFTVTPEVYSRLHSRELLVDSALWRREQLVFVLLPPLDVYSARRRENHSITTAEQYERCLALYNGVLKDYTHVELDWRCQINEAVSTIISRLESGFAAWRRLESTEVNGMIHRLSIHSSLRCAKKPGSMGN